MIRMNKYVVEQLEKIYISVNESNQNSDKIRNNVYAYREREFNKTLLDIAYTPHYVLHSMKYDPYKNKSLKNANYGKVSKITLHNQVNDKKLKDSFYNEKILIKEELSLENAKEEYIGSMMWMMNSETKDQMRDMIEFYYKSIGCIYRKGNQLIWGSDRLVIKNIFDYII